MIVGMNEVRKKIVESLGAGVPPEVIEMLLPFGLILRSKVSTINALLMARRRMSLQAELEPGVEEIRRLIADGILAAEEMPELCNGMDAQQLLPARLTHSEWMDLVACVDPVMTHSRGQ